MTFSPENFSSDPERDQFETIDTNKENARLKEVCDGWIDFLSQERERTFPLLFQESLARLLLNRVERCNLDPGPIFDFELQQTFRFYEHLYDTLKQVPTPAKNGWNFASDKAGILGEYAVAKSLALNGMKVYHPNKEDNHYRKVDWWFQENDSELINGIQVKTISSMTSTSDEAEFIHPKSFNSDHTPGFTNMYYGEYIQYLANRCYAGRPDRLTKMVNNGVQMVNIAQKEDWQPLIVLVTAGTFNPENGRPKQQLIDQFQEYMSLTGLI